MLSLPVQNVPGVQVRRAQARHGRYLVRRRRPRLRLGLEQLESRQLLATGTPSQVGQWGPVLDIGVMAKHAAVLPTGDVLVWSTGDDASVWDPDSNAPVTHVPFDFGDLHCAAQATMADGRVIVLGGPVGGPHSGTKITAMFDPFTGTWTRGADMNLGRWYGNATTLPDGRVLASSGDSSARPFPEVYDPVKNTWTLLSGVNRAQPLYPFMTVLPDGRVYEAGNKAATWILDVSGAGSWSPGAINSWGTSGYKESAVTYAPGKILREGGGSSGKAAVIDMNAATPAWRTVGSLSSSRNDGNLVLLPDGSVMATGGGSLTAEIWDRDTERWTTAAAMSEGRDYHSSAFLLPDGRVATGGGDSGGRLHVQVYSPPYLFAGHRPTIASSPDIVSYGSTFKIRTPDAASITSVAMMRPSAVTHGYDQNQRYVPLSFTTSGGELAVSAPANGNIAPPGYYMLVIEDSTGVPSVAAWLRVDSSANLKPGAITGHVTDTSGLGIAGARVSYSDGSVITDADGAYRLSDIPAGQHEVTVSAPGFATVRRAQSVQPAEAVTLDLELTVAGMVSGRVTAMDTGAPIGGATITYPGGSTTTDVDGNYLITDIAPGNQAIAASASGYHEAGHTVAVAAHASAGLDFALAVKLASIRGEIEDAATGEPIVGATVQYSGGTITTNDLGFYLFENVPPGAHVITVSANGYVTASNQVDVEVGSAASIDLDFRLHSSDGPRPTLTAAFQDGLLPDSNYAGTRDTFIRVGTATRNYGAATVLEVNGKPDDAALLRWDLHTIPAGSKVRSATLTVNVVNKTIHNYEVYELKRNWSEGQATWNEFSTGTRWETPGASGATDRGSTALGTAPVAVVTAPAAGLGLQDINLNATGLAVVESWINNPAANNGIIIQNYTDTNNDDIDFNSREMAPAAIRPKLTVVYELNVPPVLDPIGAQSVDEGSPLSFKITASDANRERLAYAATGLPDGASFDADTRTFSWTPGEAQDGTHSVTFSVSDGTATDSETITITVGELNQPPVLSPIGNKSGDEGSLLRFTILASDTDIVDGLPQALTYSPIGAPLGAAFDENTQTFSWTPSPDQDGVYTVGFLVDDGGAIGALETITITVGAPVLAPIGSKSVDEESLLSFKISATDAGHDPLTYSTGPLPDGASFAPATQIFSWTPSRDQDGNHSVAFNVTDGHTTDSETITITVGAPVLATIGNKSVDEGRLLSFTIAAADAGNDPLTYSTGVLPDGATFEATNRLFTWTPAENQDGSYSVSFAVNDGTTTDSETITIIVNDVNQPPAFEPTGDKSVEEGSPLSFTVAATDADVVNGVPNSLSYSAGALPPGAAFDPATRTFSWTPTETQDGNHQATFRVSDGRLTFSQTITISVGEQNLPPVLAAIGNKPVSEGSPLIFTVSATDADVFKGSPNRLTYDAIGLPSGARLDSGTRTFTWTPAEDQDGIHRVTVNVSDGTATVSETITITVSEMNQAPVLATIGNKSVDEGHTLTFPLAVTDSDLVRGTANTLIFSTSPLPTGATFDSATRTFRWTPLENQDGLYKVTFSVSDGTVTISEPITITVGELNQPPLLEAIGDQSISETKPFMLTVTATDGDLVGNSPNKLTYSATGLPTGAAFNPLKRTLSWTPTETQDGSYRVTFSVTDGLNAISQTITITVAEVGLPPVIAPFPKTLLKGIPEGSPSSFELIATDGDLVNGLASPLSYSATGLPAGASFDTATHMFKWTPTEGQDGTYRITFTVSDGPATASQVLTLAVSEVNQLPLLAAIGNRPISEGNPLGFTVSATDADFVNGLPNKLTLSTGVLPAGATFNAATGEFSWKPTEAQDGVFKLTFTVTDGIAKVSEIVTVTVGEINQPPVLTLIANKSVTEGMPLSFTVSGTDPDLVGGKPVKLSYSVAGLPAGASFSSTKGAVTWAPDESQDGTYNATVSVSDGTVTVSQPVTITVVDLNQPPLMAPMAKLLPKTGFLEGVPISLVVTATDLDVRNGVPDTLRYSASDLPAGANFDPATRTLDWTPTEAQDGTHKVTFNVSDGLATTSQTVMIVVKEVNQDPVMLGAIGDRTVQVGSTVSVSFSAMDIDLVNGVPNTLNFAAAGLPIGATYDLATRTFSWTPAADQAGFHNILFSVTDGTAKVSRLITLTVPAVAAVVRQRAVDEAIASLTHARASSHDTTNVHTSNVMDRLLALLHEDLLG